MNKLSTLLLGIILAGQGFLSTVNAVEGFHFKKNSQKNPRPFELLPNREKVLTYLREIFELLYFFNRILIKGYSDSNDKIHTLKITDAEKLDIQNNFSKFSKLFDDYQDNYKREKSPNLMAHYLGILPVELKDVTNKIVKIIRENPGIIPYLVSRGKGYLAREARYVRTSPIKEIVQEDIVGESEGDLKEEKEKVLALFKDILATYNQLGSLGEDVLGSQRDVSLKKAYYERSANPEMTKYYLLNLPGLLVETEEKLQNLVDKELEAYEAEIY